MSSTHLTPTLSESAEIDLSDIGWTLRRQWRKIVICGVLFLVVAVLNLMLTVPKFTVAGSLYLGDSQTDAGSAAGADADFSFLSAFQNSNDVATQIELMQAKGLLEQAILETGLNSTVAPLGDSPLSFWRWRVFYGKSIKAYAPMPGGLSASFATLADPQSGEKVFVIEMGQQGHYDVKVPGVDNWFGQGGTVLSGVLGQPAAGDGLSLLIKPAVDGAPPAPGARFRLRVMSAPALADGLLNQGQLTILAGGTITAPTKVAHLQMVWTNPYDALRFLNQLMGDFIATQLSWKTQSASVTEAFVSSQLDNIRGSLDAADQKLASFQSQTGIIDVPETAKAVIQQLSQYETQRTGLQLQQEALQQLANQMAHPGRQLNPYLVSQTSDVVLSQLATTLANAQVQLEAQGVEYTDDAMTVQIQTATVAKIEESIHTLIRNDLKLAAANLADLNAMIAHYQTQLKSMPAHSLQVVELARSSDVFGQLYVLLMEKEEEAEVSKAATIVDTRIVTPAELPLAATSPRPKNIVLAGLFIGLFIGCAFVLAWRAISGRFQSDDEIKRAVKLPIYAIIPKRAGSGMGDIVFSSQPNSPFAESFRLLRGNLYQSAVASHSRVILITSSSSGEGKTTIALNLAKTLADAGKRVLLIDADLHRGRVHKALKLDQAPGLTEWLVQSARPVPRMVPGQRFMVITVGMLPPNPSELLDDENLARVFDELRPNFDHIIVDCPPLPVVADTISLGRHADLVLSTALLERTSRRAFAAHNDIIAGLQCRHGIIICGASQHAYGFGYGYGYGYGYGARDVEDEPRTMVGRFMAFLERMREMIGTKV